METVSKNEAINAAQGCEWCENRHLRSARRVMITWKFEDDYSSGTVVDRLAYCPFCGKELERGENQ